MAVGDIMKATRCAGLFLGSARCHGAVASCGRNLRTSFFGQKTIVEKLWQEFFSNPSQWWDHRSEKVNARYPDFKHKRTQDALWVDSNLNPPWLEAKLAAMVPGTLQSNIFSWNTRLARYVKAGKYGKAMELFHQMRREGISPDRFTFVRVLNACANLQAFEEGRQIHAQVIKSGYLSNVYVGSSLVDMYAKFGCIHDAWGVFNDMPTRDVVAWNAMISGFVKCGQGQKAFDLYERMQQEEVKPAPVTFISLLNACTTVAALEQCRSIHEQIIQSGCDSDVFVLNKLIDMYCKCGSVEDAWRVFRNLETRDVVAWNAIILGHVKCGQGQKALELFRQMQSEGLRPVPLTFVGALNACARVVALEDGKRIHKEISQYGLDSDAFVGSSLVDMYAKCGSIEDACIVFSKMPTHNVVAWNALILGHVKCGQGQKALELFQQMQLEAVEPDPFTYVGVLNACASVMALEEGRHVHKQIIKKGYESDAFVLSSLIDMYAKCGSIEDVRRVFSKTPAVHDVVSWNAMILGHVKCGESRKALELFPKMQQEGVAPGPATFVALLNACATIRELEEGRRIHEEIIQSNFEADILVGSGLIDMYAKCGSIEDAWRVFSKMGACHGVAWNALILGYTRCGLVEKALELSQQMQMEGITPNSVTFVGMLNACASIMALEEGRRVHEWVIQLGYTLDVSVSTGLVDMYAKCGSIEDALTVFNEMPIRDVFSWSAMILGHSKCGQGRQALELFNLMLESAVEPVPITFVGVLNACASLAALEEGKRLHKQIIQCGCSSDVFVGSSLIDMYVKCGSIQDAWDVFDKMPTHDVVSWNSMIFGYAKCGKGDKALELFLKMQWEGVEPVPVTFVAILNACASLKALDEGRRIHRQVIQKGCETDVFVGSGLVDMYAKCGSIEDASGVFDNMPDRDVVSWNSMILGYVKCGQGKKALELLPQMQQEGVEAVPLTFVAVLNACASIGEEGKMVHEQIIQKGLEHHLLIGNSLVDMYGKCGNIEEASSVFNRMPVRDVVSWSAMILGFVRCGHGRKALDLFQQLRQEKVVLVPAIFVGVLNACASELALEEGRQVHEQINQSSCDSDVFVGNSLIDMYAKCGSIEEAWSVFDKMSTRDTVSWNAMIGGYAMHGYHQKALEHFEHMYQAGARMDKVTFVSLLSACGHAGLVDEGFQYFETMDSLYGVSPAVEHYACVVDLLGRAGYLHEAEDLIRRMSPEPNVAVWMSLLGACKVHGNAEMGELIAEQVLTLDPHSPASYVLLSNIYSAAGRWEEVERRFVDGVRRW